ncbi:hypothetical protein Fcan01_09986 [Folsomia candida]|uniref:Uncharacterized protein n=1 Tax=Folsomia candida TaxID=158441 RepID=A0A226ED74_FOLCA|nr:hypothetical protein Fcan01_09986 [Folsomia candida]
MLKLSILALTLSLISAVNSSPNDNPTSKDRSETRRCARDRCPLDQTTFNITTNIPFVKDPEAPGLEESLQCETFNYCGDGKKRTTCPIIDGHDKADPSYQQALTLAVIKSNLAPGSIFLQIKFNSDKTADINLRYVKYGNVTKIPADIPTGWDNLEKDIENDSSFYEDIVVIKTTLNIPKDLPQPSTDEAGYHAIRVTEFFKLILGAKSVTGKVFTLEKQGAPWVIIWDKVTLTFDEDWTRDDCRERYPTYLDFFDTESDICTKV